MNAEEGGGYLISFPDLPGCMSDGETIDEAIANGQDAFSGWDKHASMTIFLSRGRAKVV